MSPRLCSLLAAVVLGLVLCLGAAPAPRVRALVLSGAPATGGLTFASFGRSAANERGSICFLAGWDGVNRRRAGLYLQKDGQVMPVARTGDPVPGSTAGRISFPPGYADEFSSFCMNNRDEVAYIVRQGLYLYSAGKSRAVARIGSAVPGVQGVVWDEILAVSLNEAGEVAFVGATRAILDGERLEGLFLLRREELEIVLYAGDALPELTEELIGFSGVSLNDRGEIACLARVGEEERDAILLLSEEATRVIALQDEVAPGGTWSDLGSVALNDAGELAFQGCVAGAEGEQTGLYRTSGEGVTAVALPGQVVSTGGGERLGEFLARPVLDTEGNIAFVADLDGQERRQALVVADRDRRVLVLERQGRGGVQRFAGLNQGSLIGGRVVCSVVRGSAGDAVGWFAPGRPAEFVVSTSTPLPLGSALHTVDDETAPRETEAGVTGRGDLLFLAEVGGYGRALFRMGEGGPELLTPLGGGGADEAPLRSVIQFSVNGVGTAAFLGYRDEEGSDAAIYTVSSAPGVTPRVVFRTGQAVPGAGRQVVARLGLPQIAGDGSVLFTAEGMEAGAEPGSAAPTQYLLAARGGRVEVAAAEGARVDGVGTLRGHTLTLAEGTLSTVFRDLQVNKRGQALFLSSFQEIGTDVFAPSGLFCLEGGSIRPVARIGQATPLRDGSVFNGFTSPRLGEDGAIAFLASVVGAGRRPRTGLFRFADGEMTVLAVTGDLVPGLQGALYRGLQEPLVGGNGETIYLALLDGAPGVRRRSALCVASARGADLLIGGTQGGDESGLRLDDAAPPAPVAMTPDGRLLVAGRMVGENGPAGLFTMEIGGHGS